MNDFVDFYPSRSFMSIFLHGKLTVFPILRRLPPNLDAISFLKGRKRMRYVMKQKLFSWADSFSIKDETGRDVFLVDGQVFSFGDQLSFKDLLGNELASIQQQLLSWGPTYNIYKGGQLYAVVKKELFTFFNCRFTVDVPGPNDLEAEGDFLHHEYVIGRGGEAIARVSKQWFSWSDTYGVEVANGQDDILILASTVVIDMACHDKES